MKKVFIVDNYDSFTYNLVHIIKKMNYSFVVERNDILDIKDIGQYDKIILSPGPGIPKEAGKMQQIIAQYHQQKSILGICLGHQGIAEVFGATLTNMHTVIHGRESSIQVCAPDYIFRDIPSTFIAGRYHSWIVNKDTLPACLSITAQDEKEQIMAIAHNKYDVKGLQFHPESIMTTHGSQIIANWMEN